MVGSFRAAPLVAAVALLMLPQLAAAGPVKWSYRATAETVNGAGWLSLGGHRLLVEDPQGVNTRMADFDTRVAFGRTTTTGGGEGSTHPGEPYRYRALSLWDGEQVRYHEVGSGPPPVEPVDAQFRLTLEFTDDASGETATAEFLGTGGLVHSGTYGGYRELELTLSGTAVWTLGGNRYEVELADGRSESGDHVALSVQVTPSATTPEPGTLLMAGLGLTSVTGLAVRRARRRAVT